MLKVIAPRQLQLSVEKRGNVPTLILSQRAPLSIVIGPPRDVIIHSVVSNPSAGLDGRSAYELWLDEDNEGSVQDFLASLQGEDGEDGNDGASAYQLWLDEGNAGEVQDFLDSLHGEATDGEDGEDGVDGKSAYEIWLQADHEGSEVDFLDWLRTTSVPNPPPIYPTVKAGWSDYEGIPLRLDLRGDTLWIRGVVILNGIEYNDSAAFSLPPEIQLINTIAFTGAALAFLLPVAAMVYIDSYSGDVFIKVQLLEDWEGPVGPVYFNVPILLGN